MSRTQRTGRARRRPKDGPGQGRWDGPVCGAKNRQGSGHCKRPAGWGTDHLGYGECSYHGGKTRAGRVKAAKLAGRIEAQVMGAPIDIDPYDALLWCVRIAAGEVKYLSHRVHEIEADAAVGPHVTTTRSRDDDGRARIERVERAAELHVWIRARQDALDRLAKFSKMAVDAGIAERQVRLAEGYGNLLARLVGGILDDLALTKRQERLAPEIVHKHLTAIEGSAVELPAPGAIEQ